MKQERVILSFIMVLIGLLVAGAAFYFYQSTKVVSSKSTVSSKTLITPTPLPSIFLSINTPNNETVVSNKSVFISGKTSVDATVIIITEAEQIVLKPSLQGDFSTTLIIDNGQNLIRIQSISPNGEIASAERTVTYSTNNF